MYESWDIIEINLINNVFQLNIINIELIEL